MPDDRSTLRPDRSSRSGRDAFRDLMWTARAAGSVAALALLGAALLLSACGGGSGAPRPAAATQPSGPPVTRTTVTRELGDGVHAALGRLAVMQQQSDDASTLAEDLPAGTLRDVACRDAAAAARWTCTVRWRTVDGRAQTIRYAVRVERRRCFVAAATPQRPTVYDATIHASSVDPLNLVSSARRGC